MTILQVALILSAFSFLEAQTCQITPLLPFALPPNVDIEPLSASRTLNLAAPVSAANGVYYFTDAYARLRRLDANGTVTTVIGKSINRPWTGGIVRVDRESILHVALGYSPLGTVTSRLPESLKHFHHFLSRDPTLRFRCHAASRLPVAIQ